MDMKKLFKEELAKNSLLAEALEIVASSTRGIVYVTGSVLYGRIVARAYGFGPSQVSDFDFVVESNAERKKIAEVAGWRAENSFLNSQIEYSLGDGAVPRVKRFFKKNVQMDVGVLTSYDPPEIDILLAETPLNVQSLAYDVRSDDLIGERGMSAIREKVVAVNFMEDARSYAAAKRKTVEQLVQSKASQLGFEADVRSARR